MRSGLSILYYPRFPSHPSYPHVKLRAGKEVVSAQHDWSTYEAITRLANQEKRRRWLLENSAHLLDHSRSISLQVVRGLRKMRDALRTDIPRAKDQHLPPAKVEWINDALTRRGI